jgi:Type 5 capsule protein repressor C-terminal domain
LVRKSKPSPSRSWKQRPGSQLVRARSRCAGGRQLTDVSGTLDELQANVRYMGDAYLRVAVKTGGPVPNLADAVRDILPNAVEIRVEYPRQEAEARERNLSTLEPLDQYLAYYRSYHGVEPEQRVVEAFTDVLELELEAH